MWQPFHGEYQCRAGGGLWAKGDSRWFKLAELAEGIAVITDREGKTHPVPAQAAALKTGQLEVRGQAEVNGVAVQVVSRWEWADEHTLRWCFTFEPSQGMEDCLFSVHFNLLPSQWGTLTFPSYCGFHNGLCYAIYPEREAPWWMRLEGAKLVKNVHYPFTYRPTKKPQGSATVSLAGRFLVAPWPAERLNRHLRDYFAPVPQPARVELEKTQAVCLQGLLRAEAAARAQGFLADDEVAFLDIVRPERWRNQGRGPAGTGPASPAASPDTPSLRC